MRGFEMCLYCHLHEHYRLIDLSEQSTWLGLFTAVLIDFGYYWIHRANHGNMQK
jgi:alkylglycerol monooxygenase